MSRHPSRSHRPPFRHAVVRKARRQLDVNGHLRAPATSVERHGDERALVEPVGVEPRPPVGRAPREHELLVGHDLAVDAAREVGRVLVDDHVLAPDAADTQVELDRLARDRLGSL